MIFITAPARNRIEETIEEDEPNAEENNHIGELHFLLLSYYVNTVNFA